MHQKSSRIYIISICVILSIYVYYQFGNHGGGKHTLPPLPGTYQYSTSVDFYSKTHKMGAVSHCDTRYAPKYELGDDEIRGALRTLLATYAKTMRDLDVTTWMAHGTLLGWYWNKKLLPWDTDLDVQVPYEDLMKLALSHNMTEFQVSASPDEPVRTFVLDVSPFYSLLSLDDVANHIDARWIDTHNGKFIDITAVHRGDLDDTSALVCKDGHRYQEQEIYPLRQSQLEGISVNVPTQSDKVLSEEYGAKSLTNTKFHWYKFNTQTQVWEAE